MPTSIEAQGVTVEEAIQVALNQLGVTRDRVEIEIVHHSRGGFLGLGARRAKVRATLRESAIADGQEYDMSGGLRAGRGRRGRRGSRRRRSGRRGGGRQESKDGAEQSGQRGSEREQRSGGDARSEAAARGGQRRRRGQDGREQRQQRRGPEGRTASASGRSERDLAGSPPPTSPSSGGARPGADTPAAATPASSTPHEADTRRASEPADDEAAPIVTTDEVRQRALTIVSELLRHMGFQAQVDTVVDEREREIIVRVSCEADGLLIGRRGQTLDAIEHLINRMVATGETSAESRVVLDVGGYRDRRRQALLELADRLKVRAMTQNRRIQLSPMSPRDRRILQAVLAQDDAIGTRVQGTGFYRRLVIYPAGLADESDAAATAGSSEETEAGLDDGTV